MKIGTRVRVVDESAQFTYKQEIFKIMGFKDCNEPRDLIYLKNYKEIKFVIFSKFELGNYGNIYGIIDDKGNQYLISKEGLQKIKKSKKVKEDPTEEVKEKPFPKVMKAKSSELIVHFDKKGVGRVLQSNDKHNIGYFSDDWAMRTFEDIKEPITITFN
jgi:hypothetical protein